VGAEDAHAMRLRLLPVVAVALLALAASAGSSSSATAKPTIEPFLGDWTMTAAADSALVGGHLVITQTTADSAYALVGPEWTNVSGTAWYDTHCGSKATVYAYVVLNYSWSPQASMGGCLSNKTVPHVVFAGLHREAGSVRVVGVSGLDQLSGTWDTIPIGGICCVHHLISGSQPTVDFTVGEQGHRAQPKSKDGPKFLLTRLVGIGSVSVAEGSTNSGGVFTGVVGDATGTIHFHKWRVYEHGVVDEDLLVLKVQRTDGAQYVTDGGLERLNQVAVVVTKTEHNEADICPVGATGTLTMAELKSGPHKGTDLAQLTIVRCNVVETFINGRKSAKVAVGLTYNQP
jgi:hypothetical protein